MSDRVADVAQDLADLAAEKDQGDDGNDRDEGEDEGVFGEALTTSAGFGAGASQHPDDLSEEQHCGLPVGARRDGWPRRIVAVPAARANRWIAPRHDR